MWNLKAVFVFSQQRESFRVEEGNTSCTVCQQHSKKINDFIQHSLHKRSNSEVRLL
jgi:hypothetical protein